MAGDEPIRDPLEAGEDKASRIMTSGNREESMTESGKDAFGKGGAIRTPDSTSQSDGSAVEPGEQDPSESGTTSLGGESRESGDIKGPGGVEGTS